VYVFVALMLPLIGLALTFPAGRAVRALVGLFVGYLVITQAAVLVARERSLEDPQLRADVLGLGVLTEEGEDVLGSDLAVDVHERSVGAWAERGDLGDLGAVPDQWVSDVRGVLQVSVRPSPPGDAEPGGLLSAGDETISGQCVTTVTTPGELAATLELDPGTTVSVVAPNGGELGYQVVEPGPAGRLVTVPVEPNRTYWFAVTEPLTLDVVAKQGQPLEFCGA
jgi:hypothetical protein